MRNSPDQISPDQIEWVPEQYRTRYWNFTAKHFHEQLVCDHGFNDAYLRGYEGDPREPFGVVKVEWNGLVDNLMGDARHGRVTAEMIESLIGAYSGPGTN